MHGASSVKHSPGTPDRNLDAFTYLHRNCPYNQLGYKALRHLGVGGFRMNDRVRAGAKAPDFTLPAQSGEMVRLKDFLGQPVVMVFQQYKEQISGATLLRHANQGWHSADRIGERLGKGLLLAFNGGTANS
jgi:hypothetical protein